MRSGFRGDVETCRRSRSSSSAHLAERVDPNEPERQQRDVDPRKAAQACGRASRAARPRASMATAVGSLASCAWNTPLRISRTLPTPSWRSSLRVRSASVERRRIGTRDEDERRLCRIAQALRSTRRRAPCCALSPESGPRHDVPPTFVSMKLDHAAGSSSRRRVWPVGAVSKMTWSNAARGVWRPRAASRTRRTRRSRRCTRPRAAPPCWRRRPRAARRGRARRRARGSRARPARDRCSARRARARPARPSATRSSVTPSTSSRFEAGSVLTSSTRLPASARPMAVAQAEEVLPTPPLPVKNRMRVGFSISVDMTVPSAAATALRGRSRVARLTRGR